jgi:aminoglycoside 6'-N-acetyltransferase I
MHIIRIAEPRDRDELAAMRLLLWPECLLEEEKFAIDGLLSSEMCGTLPATIFVAEADNGELIGFLDVGLRSHADGCDTRRAVGFVEGWFVREASRNKGAGRAMMRAAEDWARAQGCIEMASDALITEEGSHRAHAALGFEVVDRCVHFRKAV